MRWRAPGNHRAADNAVAGGRRGQRSTSSQSARQMQHAQADAQDQPERHRRRGEGDAAPHPLLVPGEVAGQRVADPDAGGGHPCQRQQAKGDAGGGAAFCMQGQREAGQPGHEHSARVEPTAQPVQAGDTPLDPSVHLQWRQQQGQPAAKEVGGYVQARRRELHLQRVVRVRLAVKHGEGVGGHGGAQQGEAQPCRPVGNLGEAVWHLGT
ncbi:hypothetical protein G6F22_016229 [Rhizopus arrhizus]|nr:hypothetical protein G6F22_016229 [Rhizopus arrhizus]